MTHNMGRIDSTLKSIVSRKEEDKLFKLYEDLGQSMKEIGAPTNNGLLNLVVS